ncbi:hypothetical protein I0C86_39295 [Plantactinospora sp. S1510]|uniref:Uncharacterized protein n=1 Tax=Plantactinospora alkalitolerans TaxID=2789879 RepID=A0ABS0H9I6_9ACTN|nr:hypothetical protein [Plantactinospora alkalitolerans]MBF9134926.1 hypothetical protein [Plantactinospora alkalitolerans]
MSEAQAGMSEVLTMREGSEVADMSERSERISQLGAGPRDGAERSEVAA